MSPETGRARALRVAGALVVTAAVFVADYKTGAELSLSLLYLGPIAFQAETGWQDMNEEGEPPSVMKKRFDWLQFFFDGESLQTDLPVKLETAVRERSYFSSPAWDQTIEPTIRAGVDGFSVGQDRMALARFFMPNAHGRFLRYRLSATRPSCWGLHEVAIEFDPMRGF